MKISKWLSILLVLALLLCLLPAAALADPEDSKEAEEQSEPVDEDEAAEEAELPLSEEEDELPEAEAAEGAAPQVNGEDETCYPLEGETVYNNGGTVYNNGGVVYNNGGLVYNNSGTVYNNGGVVYANGGLVYHNGGTVYRNSATVYTFADEGLQDSRIYGSVLVTTAEDYSAFAQIEGPDEKGVLLAGESCTIRVRDGVLLESVESSSGTLTQNEDGSWTLTDPEEDLTLTLLARTEAPVFDLEAGSYVGEQTLIITAPADAAVYYTLDGSSPDAESAAYEEPLLLTEGCTVSAVAILPGTEPSAVTAADYAIVVITPPELPDGTQGEEPPAPAAFTVSNPGSTDLVIESVTLSGRSASYFSLSTEEGGTVKAGESDSETWTLQPASDLTKGNYKAVVVFTLAGGQTVEFEVRYKVK